MAIWLCFVPLLPAQQAERTSEPAKYDADFFGPNWKNPAEKLAFLKAWAERFPDSEFKIDRLVAMIRLYQELARLEEAYSAAKQLKTVEPFHVSALYYLASLPVAINVATPERLNEAEASAFALEGAIPNIVAQSQRFAQPIPNLQSTFEQQVAKTRAWVADKRRAAQLPE